MPSERHPRRLPPEPRAAELERYAGLWVALANDEVVAAEPTSHALALSLRSMGNRERNEVVVEYVRPASASYIVGVG